MEGKADKTRRWGFKIMKEDYLIETIKRIIFTINILAKDKNMPGLTFDEFRLRELFQAEEKEAEEDAPV